MKQGNSAGAMIDLDDLERQLSASLSSKKTVGDDPLAELARIVGRDEVVSSNLSSPKSLDFTPANGNTQRVVPSFDDFLKVPPRPASGVMPSRTPPVEPLFPDVFPKAPYAETGTETQKAGELSVVTSDDLASHEEFDDLEPHEANPNIGFFDEDDDIENEKRILAKSIPTPAVQAGQPTNHFSVEAVPAAAKNNFDDMLAEFEAAMKDVGAEKAIPASVPSLAPIVIPPPPDSMVDYQNSSSVIPSFGSSGVALGLGAAAGAAGAIAAGGLSSSMASSSVIASNQSLNKSKVNVNRGLMIAGGVIGIAVIGVFSLFYSGGGTKMAVGKDAPTIAAKPGVVKERPVNPGGVEVANQDKEVLQSKVAETKAPERVAPREEQPVDLTQAQRTAQNQPLVRQIPGILIVAPTSTTPPANSSASANSQAPAAGASPSVAGNQPVPRPVASVPIGITGQPAPVGISAPTPVLNPAAAPTSVTSAPPASFGTATPSAVVPPTAAEPRRVRAVPIRTETADAAPTRAQAQPRVVQANPRKLTAEEPDDANAPLRITPQANRVPVRVAAAQPATTQTAAPQAAPATGGSGFTVQLAAEGSEDAARAKFNRVKGQYSDVLGSYSPNIRSAEVNGKSVYRVRVGSLSREEAVGLCERLKASGGSCFVAKN